MSNKAIEIDFGFSVNDGNGKQVAYKQSTSPDHFDPMGIDTNCWGFADFATCLSLLSLLINGTLVIEVHVRLGTPTKSVPPLYIPENPFAKNIQRMIIDEKFGDISFAVGGQQNNNNAEVAKETDPIIFHAHRDILRECSTGILVDICDSKVVSDGLSTLSPVEITDVSPEVFRHLLQSEYGISISDEDMKSQTKEVIDAANRYGVVSLKLEAEACLVKATTFTMENVVMEQLLYADL